MGNVPGTNSCPVADVVTLVPSQAAACDTHSDKKVKRGPLGIFNIHSVAKYQKI